MLPSGSTLRGDGHVLVAGVDGVRFDLVGPQITPSVWGIGQAGFLAKIPIDEAARR